MYRSLGTLRSFLQGMPWPDEFLQPSDLPFGLMDRILVMDFSINARPEQSTIWCALALEGELGVSPSGFDLVKLVLGGDAGSGYGLGETPFEIVSGEDLGGETPLEPVEGEYLYPPIEGYTFLMVSLAFHSSQTSLMLHDLTFSLQFDPMLLKPVALHEDDPIPQHVAITVRGTVTLNQSLDIIIQGFDRLDLSPAMIGNTGIIISAKNVRPNFLATFPSITLDEVEIRLPDDLPLPGISLIMSDARIDSTGFSGEVSLDLALEYNEATKKFKYQPITGGGISDAEIFGIPGGLRHIGIRVEQNQLIGCDISGAIVIPYFDKPVDIRLDIQPDGSFVISLLNLEPDKPLTKDELLELYLESLQIGWDSDNNASLVLSGGLKPLLQSSDGMGWPRLDVKDLLIDSTGKFSIKEAWLDLAESKPLDLYGFTLDLDRIGLGTETDKMWIDLSGSLRLLPQIPVGLGVEGFRLLWPMTLPEIDDPVEFALEVSRQIEIQFKGVQLFFGVPDAIEFEGLIRFFKSAQAVGFMGDVALRVPATGFGVEAGLLVGMTFTPPIYPFLYVALAVDLPAGIPLAQSGLALKGAQGMFGINVRPDRSEEQNWYYDWYKRTPVGAHPASKWINHEDALAFGVGVTITTADGYVKGTRGLLVLSLPGPVLMIEGRALLFNGLTPGEPPLRALAVFDGNARTVQFNVDAQATIVPDLVDAYGGLEAFFDFNDVTNWHLYLGQDSPPDRLIQANVLAFAQANAYLMLDMINGGTQRTRMGVSVGFNPLIRDVGPVHIDFDATLNGNGIVTIRPEQFSGNVGVDVNLGLSAFGFNVGGHFDGNMSVEGPRPLTVAAEVNVSAELPSPLGTFEHTFELMASLKLQVPTIESPLTEIAVNSRFAPSGGGFSIDPEKEGYEILELPDSDDWQTLAERSPVVQVDATPILSFSQVMNSQLFAGHPSGRPHKYAVGPLKFTPRLAKVELFVHKKSDDWTGESAHDWQLVASSGDTDLPLPGVWLTESDPQSPTEPAPRRLQLWTDNPLIHTGRAPGSEGSVWSDQLGQNQSLAERILDDYPDLMQSDLTEHRVCIRFDDAAGVTIPSGTTWQHRGVSFSVPTGQAAFAVHQDSRTETGPVPNLSPLRINQIVSFLGKLHKPFQDPANISHKSLRAWAASIPPTKLNQFRLQSPTLARLWNWLIPHTTTFSCLEGGKSSALEIHFPTLVRDVRIRFCDSNAPPIGSQAVEIQTSRPPRFAAEIEKVIEDSKRKGNDRPDLQSCLVSAQRVISRVGDRWIVSADEGFRCLSINMTDGALAIQEICYLNVSEAERVKYARQQDEINQALSPVYALNLLQPGAYYRLEVSTDVEGVLDVEDGIPDGWLGIAFEEVYETAMDLLSAQIPLPLETTQAIFFQTEGPPANLLPYIKWNSPEHQSERVFCSNDIVVRFLRSNIGTMYSEPFGIEIQVHDAKGKIVPVEPIRDLKATTATRFPEEEAWEKHRNTLNWPNRPIPNDDYLIAKLKPSIDSEIPNMFNPKARYTVELLGADLPGSNPKKVLHTFTFTSSAFHSFRDLVGSFSEDLAEPFSGEVIVINGKSPVQITDQDVLDAPGMMIALAEAEFNWQKDLIDYRFDALEDGRAGLETARLKRRKARAAHDQRFREIAEKLADLYYQPLSDKFEVYAVKNPDNNEIICLWLRSPESLDLQLAESGKKVGRTEIRLSTDILTQISNADSTQVLLFHSRGLKWPPGTHKLKFRYHQDPNDQNNRGDPRYDRPVEMTAGASNVISALISFKLRSLD